MADDNSNNESSGVSEEQQKANLEKITAEIEKLEKIREKSENRRILAEAGISEELVNQLRLQQEQVEKKIKQSALSKELSKEQAELLAKELLIEQKKEEAIKKQIEAQKKSLDIQEKAADETKRQLDEFAELTLGIRDYSDQLDAIGKNTGDMLKGLTKGVAKFGKNLVFNFGVSQLKAQFEAFQNLRKEMDQASDMLGKATNAGVKWNNTLDRAFDSQKKLGISMMEVADSLTAITTTTPEFKKLRDTNASLATQVGGTSVLMTKLGASAQEAGSLYKSAFDQAISSGMGAEEAARQGEQTMREFAGMSVALEVPLSNLISQYEESKDKLVLLGKTGQKEFLKMAASADKLGISIGAMTAGAGELFDVEAIAGRVGEVNNILGRFGGELLDFNKFMVMDAEDRSAELARLVGTAGVDITELYRQGEAGDFGAKAQLRSFQEVFGGELQIEEMVKKVGGIQGLDVSDIEIAAEKASQQDALEAQVKSQMSLGEIAKATENMRSHTEIMRDALTTEKGLREQFASVLGGLSPIEQTLYAILTVVAGWGLGRFLKGRFGKGRPPGTTPKPPKPPGAAPTRGPGSRPTAPGVRTPGAVPTTSPPASRMSRFMTGAKEFAGKGVSKAGGMLSSVGGGISNAASSLGTGVFRIGDAVTNTIQGGGRLGEAITGARNLAARGTAAVSNVAGTTANMARNFSGSVVNFTKAGMQKVGSTALGGALNTLGRTGAKVIGSALVPLLALADAASFHSSAKAGDYNQAGHDMLSLLGTATGGVIGGALGALAGGVGALPGALAGGNVGALASMLASGALRVAGVDLSPFGKAIADAGGITPDSAQIEQFDDMYIPASGEPIKLDSKDEVFATKPGGAMEQAMAQTIGKMKAAFTATMDARKLSSEVVTSSAAEEEDRMARAFTKALMENKDNMPPINIHVKVPLDKRVVGEVTMETLNRKLNPANYFIE
jgi:hypothetical protein